jgi:hypothetical protein
MHDRLRDLGVFVDTLSQKEMEQAIEEMLDESKYTEFTDRIRGFSFTRSWSEITDELLKAAGASELEKV